MSQETEASTIKWLFFSNTRDIIEGKPFNTTVIQVNDPISNVKEAEIEWFYEDL